MTNEQSAFFENFYREHFETLVGYAFRFVKNWDDAKAVTQDAFLVGLKKIDAFHASENHIAWIKTTIRKKASNVNRTRQYRAGIVVPLETLNTTPAIFDSYPAIDSPLTQCADILNPGEYSLFMRAIVNREPYPKVAGDLGITEWACRKRVQRILKKLRENWDDESEK